MNFLHLLILLARASLILSRNSKEISELKQTTEAFSSLPTTTKKDVMFYRSGWPKDSFNLAPGAKAVLRCNHIRFNGNAKEAPPAFIRWFKDGKLIKSIPGKMKIFGGKKKPLIEGTKLNLTQLNARDTGTYTCKLALMDTMLNPDYLLSMNFSVNVKEMKGLDDIQKPESTLPPESKLSSTQKELPAEVIVLSILGGLLFVFFLIAVTCKLLKKRTRKLQHKASGNDVHANCEAETKEISKDRVIDTDSAALFTEATRTLKFSQISDDHPQYVNVDRYKDYFPFVKDDEWEMLERSQIDRSRIRCQVEHAMPIVLGTGNFGQVYQGDIIYQDGSTRSVAVKRLNDSCKTKEIGHFLMEAVTLLKAGYHRNIISLIGSVLLDTLEDLGLEQGTKKPPILLMEVAEEGNLKSFLQSKRLSEKEIASTIDGLKGDMNSSTLNHRSENFVVGKDLKLKDLASFVYQASRGMQHLANKKIVHRDLAARNVLLTSNRVIKIADFGLSKHIRDLQQEYYRIHSPAITPAKWTAPEALNENVFSVKSDVWSFGVLTWEIYSMGGAPYLGLPVTQLYRHLADGNRLEKPVFASFSLYSIMQQCWSWNPQERPDFNDIMQFTDNNLLSVSEPYLELHSRQEGLIGSKTNMEILHLDPDGDGDSTEKNSTNSRDSGRSSESVFTFSSSHSCEDFMDSPDDVDRKVSIVNEMFNPIYGLQG